MGELLEASVALVWFLSRVEARVLHQVVLVLESFAALLALVRALAYKKITNEKRN